MANAWLFLIFCIHHTSDHRQYCYVGNTVQDIAAYSKTQTLQDILKTLNLLREESCVSSEVEHSFP